MWKDYKNRSIFIQLLFLISIVFIIFYLVHNAQENLQRQNIASGFDFLKQEAGFDISESLVSYQAIDSYAKALWVGFLNTLKVAFMGNILAIIMGIFVGLMSFSSNGLIRVFNRIYVEIFRNIPLLLQLFFWYAIFTDLLPSVRQAISPIKNVFISNRGIIFPILKYHHVWLVIICVVFLIIFTSIYLYKKSPSFKEKKWRRFPYIKVSLILSLILSITLWLISGMPWQIDIPVLEGFNFKGGITISPEFFSLLAGLVLYTAAFNSEIIRAGIQSVSKGQWEAASALGFSRSQTMGLIVLPQSLRVIIPPITSQILNLTKNSSLAVAIAYPDFVSVANTSLNQTGQAIELILLIMIVYLIFSLTSSIFMNWYNRKVALVGL